MESYERQTSGKTLTELQKARFDRLAERIKRLPVDRRSMLMGAVEKHVFSLKDASEILECHPETLRKAIKAGELKAAKIGTEYRISKSDLQDFWTIRGGGKLFPDFDKEE